MKKLFVASAYFIVFVLLAILWYYPVVPYLFYKTNADDVMKDQMHEDLIEFYGIGQQTNQKAKFGHAINDAEKSCIFMWKIGRYGSWGLFVFGISLAGWHLIWHKRKRMGN